MSRKRSGPKMYKRPGRAVWYASLSGTEQHISLGTENEERAREAFAKLVADRGTVTSLEADDEALSDLWEEVRKRADASNTKKYAYETNLNLRRVVLWCAARNVTSSRAVNKQLIEDYKSERRFGGVSAARVNAELNAWKRMIKLAVERGMANERALSWFVKMREPRPDPHRATLNKAQIKRLLAKLPPGYREMARSALGCGLRAEELIRVRLEDVRASEVSVTPMDGWTVKSYHYRVIPISKATRKALLAWIGARDSGKLNIDQKRIWKVLHDACKAADVPHSSLHELRRVCASHWYQAGIPLRNITSWLGHGESKTTERYLRVTDSELPAGVRLPF